jgi:hypothetical protein
MGHYPNLSSSLSPVKKIITPHCTVCELICRELPHVQGEPVNAFCMSIGAQLLCVQSVSFAAEGETPVFLGNQIGS